MIVKKFLKSYWGDVICLITFPVSVNSIAGQTIGGPFTFFMMIVFCIVFLITIVRLAFFKKGSALREWSYLFYSLLSAFCMYLLAIPIINNHTYGITVASFWLMTCMIAFLYFIRLIYWIKEQVEL